MPHIGVTDPLANMTNGRALGLVKQENKLGLLDICSEEPESRSRGQEMTEACRSVLIERVKQQVELLVELSGFVRNGHILLQI